MTRTLLAEISGSAWTGLPKVIDTTPDIRSAVVWDCPL